jgi:hypothetical protein
LLEVTYYGSDGSVQQRSFTNNIVTIGSDPSCDLSLHSLAPVHCRIYLSTQGYYLEELSGRAQINQTPGPGFIKQDDILYVGPHAIRFGIRPDAVAVPPPPAVAKKEAKPKKSHPFRSCLMGCFGIFFGFALIAFGIYIWWAQPSWATKYFFWRGEPYHATDEIPDPQRDAQTLAKDEQAFRNYQNQMQQLESQQGMGIGNLVQKEIKAGEGGTLETPQGARLEIPPGAIERDANVTFGPLVSPRTFQAKGDYILLTDVFSITVNGQNHYEFRRPVTLELPARTGSHPPDPSLVEPLYWDGSKWVPFSTRVEVTPGSIRFPIAHATDVGAGIKSAAGWVWDKSTGVLGGAWNGFTQVTGTKAEIDSWIDSWGWDGQYQSANFIVHFQKPGNTKHPMDIALADSAYPLAGGRKSSDVPLFAQDIATYLEFAHSKASSLGLKPATNGPHHVFLRSIGAFAETQIGGPINIDNDFDGLPGQIDWGEFLKTTCAHEYFHVLQDEYWTTYGAGHYMSSWVETSAQTFGDLVRFKYARKEHPNPFLSTNFYLESQSNFLNSPMDDEEKQSERLFSYSWASFFIWMETESGLEDVTKSVFEKSSANFDFSSIFTQLDSAIHEKKPGSNLSTEFKNFVDFYFHDDIWKNKLRSKNWWTDRAHTRALADADAKEMYFRYPSANGTGAPTYYRERKIKNLNHLTAQFYFEDASYMRNKVKSKIVVRFEDIKKDGAAVTLYSDDFQDELPAKQTQDKKEITLHSGKDEMILFDRIGYVYHSSGVEANPTRISMTFVNDSKEEEGRDFKLRSWILLPPENVVFDKVAQAGGPAYYVVSWNSSPLNDELKKNSNTPFKGYNIYRRKVGEIEWPGTPINSTPYTGTPIYEDKALPDQKDYEYALTVIDSYDQESEKSPLLSDDPFVGEWAGSIRLTQGHLVDFSSMTEEKRKDYESIIKLANELEGLAKMGIPMSFKIEREATLYHVRDLKLAGFESDSSEKEDSTDSFKKISEHVLMFQPEPVDGKDVPPVYLKVEFEDVMEGQYSGGGVTFSWSFKRNKKPEPQPNPPIAESQFPNMMFTACL